jgi:hypothetical protein
MSFPRKCAAQARCHALRYGTVQGVGRGYGGKWQYELREVVGHSPCHLVTLLPCQTLRTRATPLTLQALPHPFIQQRNHRAFLSQMLLNDLLHGLRRQAYVGVLAG